MADLPTWKDIFDSDLWYSHYKFVLYRYRLKPDQKPVIDVPSIDIGTILSNYVKDDQPIALGFSAFLYEGSESERSFYNWHELYDNSLNVNFKDQYYDYCWQHFNYIYNSGIVYNEPIAFKTEFLLSQLRDEKQYLIESEKFYIETLDAKDSHIKSKMQNLASEYISFLQDRIRSMSDEPVARPDNNLMEVPLSNSFDTPSNLSVREELEELFLPLSIAVDTKFPCIDGFLKTYLVDELTSLIEDGSFKPCRTHYKVRNKSLFYKVLNSWKKSYTPSDIFKIQDFEDLVYSATGINPKTIKNNTVSTKSH